MSCKKIYTNDFIFENCTSVFITKELKVHRENVLFNQQKSYMPATQVYVSLQKDKDKICDQIKDIENQKIQLLNQVNALQFTINNLNDTMHHMTIHNIGIQTGAESIQIVQIERKKFIRKCPMKDCHGFLSQQWKCGICETKICNKCNEEKRETECDNEGVHQCDPSNVATMELLNKDTKPCPECGTMIHRYVGCPMMFCVECHCAWNWNTGLVEKGVIHNPHYYEFMRRGGNLNAGRNHGDIPCGGLPHIQDLRRIFDYSVGHGLIHRNNVTNLYNIHNSVTHIQHYEIRAINDLNEESTRDIRVQYMLQKIPEIGFKRFLQQSEKQKNKKRDFNNIYQMFVDVCSDIFRQIVVYFNKESYNHEPFKNFLNEQVVIFENLKNYFNEQLKKCGKSYKCVYPGINDKFSWEYNYESYLRRLQEESEHKRLQEIYTIDTTKIN